MKKKILFIFVLAIIFISNVFLDEKQISELVGLEYQYNPYAVMIFKTANKLVIINDITNDIIDEYYYEISYRDSMMYIRMQNRNMQINEYLVIYNKYIMIWYEKDSLEPKYIFGKYNSILDNIGPIPSSKIEASSELFEKEKRYSPGNMSNINLESPWVESAAGSGVGEYIKITNIDLDAIIIFSGYISFNKPYLYAQNNRPKKITVYCNKIGYKKTFELMDTPNPQILDLGLLIKNQEVIIIIEDVYKGTKYNDLCINGLWIRIKTNNEIWK